MMKRALTVSAVTGLLVALAPPLHQAVDAQPCPSSQPPGRPPGQPVGGDSGRPEGYGPGECQLLLSQSTGSAGSSFTVSGSGFSPGSNVTVTFESDPVVLAVVTADSSGSFTADVAVPDGAEPGNHTVRASGVGADGEPHAQAAAFNVVGQSQSETGAEGSQEPSSTGGSASPAATPADTGPSDASSGGDEDAAPPTASSDDGDDDVVAAAPANTTGTSGGASSTLAGVGLGIAAVTVISLLVGLRRRRHAAV